MAERVVIAEITFDDADMKRVLANIPPKIRDVENQTKRTADLFVARMFNMRSATMAFLGSFTVAGAIFGLKNFAEQLIKSAGAFGLFAEQAKKVSAQFSAWLVDVLHINPALEALTQWMDRFVVLAERLEALSNNSVVRGVGAVNAFLFGLSGPGLALQAIEKAGDLIDKMTGREDVAGFIGPPAPPGIGNEPRFAPALDALTKKQTELLHQQMLLVEGYHDLGGELETAFGDAAIEVEDLNVKVDMLVEPSRWQRFKTVIKDLVGEFEVAANMIQIAVDALTSAFTQWAEGGTLTMRKFFSSMLVMVGQALMAWGALALIRAYFTSDPVMAKAGLVAIGAGIAAFAAARAIGGGGERGGSSAPSGAAAPAGGGGGGTWNYAVSFNGPTFGFNEAMFARYIAEAQRRGERGGG